MKQVVWFFVPSKNYTPAAMRNTTIHRSKTHKKLKV